MQRYDVLKIPVSWLPEIIKDDDWGEDSISDWQTKDLSNEYDIYIFNHSRQIFMNDYVYEIKDSPNTLFGIVLSVRFIGKIKQSFDDSIVCLAKPNTKLYKIRIKITHGVLDEIKILEIKDYKTEL
jgi:hypothetical protein